MPTAAVHTWSGQKLEPYADPQDAHLMDVQFVANLGLLAKGTVLAQVTASGLFTPYLTAGSGGAEVARGFLAYDINVLSTGKVVFTTTVGQLSGELGEVYNAAPMYYSGTFRTNDLVPAGTGGLDAAAVTDLGALVSGTITDGIIRIG